MAERVSALDATIRALGAEMGPWNDMDVAMSLPGDMNAEHDAIREAVGMWDTSALKNFYVRGANALATIAYLVTRDITKLYVANRPMCRSFRTMVIFTMTDLFSILRTMSISRSAICLGGQGEGEAARAGGRA